MREFDGPLMRYKVNLKYDEKRKRRERFLESYIIKAIRQ